MSLRMCDRYHVFAKALHIVALEVFARAVVEQVFHTLELV